MNPDISMEKGGGKGKGLRKCYECNEEGHIASECPVRKARVAKGGPERLPKGKVRAKARSSGSSGKDPCAGTQHRPEKDLAATTSRGT